MDKFNDANEELTDEEYWLIYIGQIQEQKTLENFSKILVQMIYVLLIDKTLI